MITKADLVSSSQTSNFPNRIIVIYVSFSFIIGSPIDVNLVRSPGYTYTGDLLFGTQ